MSESKGIMGSFYRESNKLVASSKFPSMEEND